MKVAIDKTFPDSIHRYCIWHIMQKFPAKIGPIFCSESSFMEKLNKFVWSSHLTVAEFEEEWNTVLNEFGLNKYVWLNEIYAMRKSWIPAFFRDKPMGALLRTTSRLESTNFYFNQFVHKGDTLSEFYMCYESAIDKQIHENKKLTNGDTCVPQSITEKEIKKHATHLYTRTMFYKVQKQIKLFTRVGYLFVDIAFYILGLWGVERIPNQFLSSHWLRNAEERFCTLKFLDDLQSSNGHIVKDTSKKILTEFQSCYGKVSNDIEGLNFMFEEMKCLKIKIEEKFHKSAASKDDMLEEHFGVRPSGASSVLPPLQSNNKGSRKRIVGPAEISCDGKKRKIKNSKSFKTLGFHDSRTCPQKGKQLQQNSLVQNVKNTVNEGMESQTVDGQNVHANGTLNSNIKIQTELGLNATLVEERVGNH
ncbi:hypothetical protein POM88_040099 [Heracleum sosnowskyi]|uniref:Protein FAR1-RELATED SEQUENCE n=1 Tax=Heracleum sosnowskyi TaxID=360622 RepID=A0AAD8HDG8_9APIA|nr:hypothetical protein POM88_040099 [Heracleum sosnowskyi]